jgi:hypothetical protein
VRRLALIFAPLAVVAALFVALALAEDSPADCASFKHRDRVVRAIQAHGVGRDLTCAQIRAALVRWIDARFSARAAGWSFRYRSDCSCHIADRRLPDGRSQRFVFS